MRKITGLIHVGANSGQERELYHELGLRVLWVEADPEIYARLCANISNRPRQRAINALVADVDGIALNFNIANNEGLSSSIFPFAGHSRVWPDVHFVANRSLIARRLDRLIEERQLDYQALVLDVQCAELLVLKGATGLLPSISWIRLPICDFEAYKGAPKAGELVSFLAHHGFIEVARRQTNSFPGTGNTAEFLFGRANAPRRFR